MSEYEHENRPNRRPPKPIKYTFTTRSGKVPTVQGTNFKLGDVVNTSFGPYKVVEVFWAAPTDARVRLRKE